MAAHLPLWPRALPACLRHPSLFSLCPISAQLFCPGPLQMLLPPAGEFAVTWPLGHSDFTPTSCLIDEDSPLFHTLEECQDLALSLSWCGCGPLNVHLSPGASVPGLGAFGGQEVIGPLSVSEPSGGGAVLERSASLLSALSFPVLSCDLSCYTPSRTRGGRGVCS